MKRNESIANIFYEIIQVLITNLEQIIKIKILDGIPIMVVNNSNEFGEQLVGGFDPSEKYARQIGSSSQGSGWK